MKSPTGGPRRRLTTQRSIGVRDLRFVHESSSSRSQVRKRGTVVLPCRSRTSARTLPVKEEWRAGPCHRDKKTSGSTPDNPRLDVHDGRCRPWYRPSYRRWHRRPSALRPSTDSEPAAPRRHGGSEASTPTCEPMPTPSPVSDPGPRPPAESGFSSRYIDAGGPRHPDERSQALGSPTTTCCTRTATRSECSRSTNSRC